MKQRLRELFARRNLPVTWKRNDFSSDTGESVCLLHPLSLASCVSSGPTRFCQAVNFKSVSPLLSKFRLSDLQKKNKAVTCLKFVFPRTLSESLSSLFFVAKHKQLFCALTLLLCFRFFITDKTHVIISF